MWKLLKSAKLENVKYDWMDGKRAKPIRKMCMKALNYLVIHLNNMLIWYIFLHIVWVYYIHMANHFTIFQFRFASYVLLSLIRARKNCMVWFVRVCPRFHRILLRIILFSLFEFEVVLLQAIEKLMRILNQAATFFFHLAMRCKL